MNIISFPHRPPSIGGPGSFQTRIEQQLKFRGWRVVYPDDAVTPDVILVVGGTRKLNWLWKNKRAGVKIILRLDGLNWQHRLLPHPFRIKIKSDVTNILVRIIRDYIADEVIYQSKFIEKCWYRYAGPARCIEHVIYNAVDLDQFQPNLDSCILKKLVCLEGHVQDSDAYLKPVEYLSEQLFKEGLISETVVCGGVDHIATRQRLSDRPNISLKGRIPRERVPQLFANSIYLPLEVNPPCPNSVIEALASGTPVIGYNTGSLRELVPPESGILVPYGADPWKLEIPDIYALLQAARTVLSSWEYYSHGARNTAVLRFNIKNMTDAYISVLRS